MTVHGHSSVLSLSATAAGRDMRQLTDGLHVAHQSPLLREQRRFRLGIGARKAGGAFAINNGDGAYGKRTGWQFGKEKVLGLAVLVVRSENMRIATCAAGALLCTCRPPTAKVMVLAALGV